MPSLCSHCCCCTGNGRRARRRPREPEQLYTQVASDKGAREPHQAVGEGLPSNSSRGKEGK